MNTQSNILSVSNSSHLWMSRMLTMEDFLKQQSGSRLDPEVLIQPQAEWFEENGFNYPTGIVKWAEQHITTNRTIYSCVFHQSSIAEDQFNEFSNRSGSLGYLSTIMIQVSQQDGKPSVRVEMTVGNDRLITITKDKLVHKAKFGNHVFETWNRVMEGGTPVWKKIRVMTAVKRDHVDNYPPVRLQKYSHQLTSLLVSLLPRSCEAGMSKDLMLQRMALSLHSELGGVRINPDVKTPRQLEDYYYSTARRINQFRGCEHDAATTTAFVEATFEDIKRYLVNYAGQNPEILLKEPVHAE